MTHIIISTYILKDLQRLVFLKVQKGHLKTCSNPEGKQSDHLSVVCI